MISRWNEGQNVGRKEVVGFRMYFKDSSNKVFLWIECGM